MPSFKSSLLTVSIISMILGSYSQAAGLSSKPKLKVKTTKVKTSTRPSSNKSAAKGFEVSGLIKGSDAKSSIFSASGDYQVLETHFSDEKSGLDYHFTGSIGGGAALKFSPSLESVVYVMNEGMGVPYQAIFKFGDGTMRHLDDYSYYKIRDLKDVFANRPLIYSSLISATLSRAQISGDINLSKGEAIEALKSAVDSFKSKYGTAMTLRLGDFEGRRLVILAPEVTVSGHEKQSYFQIYDLVEGKFVGSAVGLDDRLDSLKALELGKNFVRVQREYRDAPYYYSMEDGSMVGGISGWLDQSHLYEDYLHTRPLEQDSGLSSFVILNDDVFIQVSNEKVKLLDRDTLEVVDSFERPFTRDLGMSRVDQVSKATSVYTLEFNGRTVYMIGTSTDGVFFIEKRK